jgi:gamma-glutamylcyclotransferase (GGCT)/AIG2-like uncharacterized protein YtfP
MHRVFAYGSNMHLVDLARWMKERELGRPAIHRQTVAELPGHRLVWNYWSPVREGGAANVEPHATAHVPGLLLEVDEATFAALDRKEGYPDRYLRSERTVRLPSGTELASWVYSVRDAYRRPEPVWPKPSYLGLMIEAAQKLELPAWYREILHTMPTAP